MAGDAVTAPKTKAWRDTARELVAHPACSLSLVAVQASTPGLHLPAWCEVSKSRRYTCIECDGVVMEADLPGCPRCGGDGAIFIEEADAEEVPVLDSSIEGLANTGLLHAALCRFNRGGRVVKGGRHVTTDYWPKSKKHSVTIGGVTCLASEHHAEALAFAWLEARKRGWL